MLDCDRMYIDFTRTADAIKVYDMLLEHTAHKSVSAQRAQLLLPALTSLMRDIVIAFAIDTGQDIPYAIQVFSGGDIASIRYAVSNSKWYKEGKL